MESSELCDAQQDMESMPHFVEECDNVVMSHQRWLIRSGFGKVRNHRGKRVATGSVGLVEAII